MSLTPEEIIMCLYLAIILLAQAILSMTSLQFLLSSFYLICGFSIVCAPLLLKKVAKIELRSTDAPLSRNEFLIFLVAPLAVFGIHYIAFYPGAFSPDSISQYSQAVNGSYNDWHPFIHTFVAFKIPLVLTGGWIGSIVLMQILLFSAAVTYALITIRKYTNRKYSIVAMLYVLLNPQTGCIAMYPWKDVAFAIGTLLLISFCLRIYFTDGKWMDSVGRIAVFTVVFVLTTLFRHNAILFTAPLFLAVFFYVGRKRSIALALASLMLLGMVKGPVYTAAGVESPSRRQVETLGLPMAVIGAVVKDHPERLNAETQEFVYAVAPQEAWNEKYSYGNYNSVKWDGRTNNDIIEQYGAAKVISMMIRCIKAAPLSAARGLLTLTDSVYTVTDIHESLCFPGITDNNYGIVSCGIGRLQQLIGLWTHVHLMLPHIFNCLGILHLILIAFILSRCKINSIVSWKQVLFILPVFSYNYGTTLLLTGFWDVGRFFYYTFVLFPFLIAFFLGKRNGE